MVPLIFGNSHFRPVQGASLTLNYNLADACAALAAQALGKALLV